MNYNIAKAGYPSPGNFRMNCPEFFGYAFGGFPNYGQLPKDGVLVIASWP